MLQQAFTVFFDFLSRSEIKLANFRCEWRQKKLWGYRNYWFQLSSNAFELKHEFGTNLCKEIFMFMEPERAKITNESRMEVLDLLDNNHESPQLPNSIPGEDEDKRKSDEKQR